MNLYKEKLISKEDKSVNFIFDNGLEARYVRRENVYFIVYLSSHNGCNMACRFCHLTQSKQTSMQEARIYNTFMQANEVINHYKEQILLELERPAFRINFNWMARGEPLASNELMKNWSHHTQQLKILARSVNIFQTNFNISSIFPTENIENIKLAFETIFTNRDKPTIYYSLYSLDKEFRKRWLPKAHEPIEVLDILTKWQNNYQGRVVLHHSLIEGANDSQEQTNAIIELVKSSGLKARFNLVRYNSYSEEQGRESSPDVLNEVFNKIKPIMFVHNSRIVPRVGRDVFASCGMFLS